MTHLIDVIVHELVRVSGLGLLVLHGRPVVLADVLVLVDASPAVVGDTVDPEGVADARVVVAAAAVGVVLGDAGSAGGGRALLLLIQTLMVKYLKSIELQISHAAIKLDAQLGIHVRMHFEIKDLKSVKVSQVVGRQSCDF